MNPPGVSHSHPGAATCPPLHTAETSLHQPLLLPSAFTVDHDLEGATFHRWLPLDRPLQGGRHPAVGVEQALVGRVPGSTRAKTVRSASTAIGGLSAKSRRVFPGQWTTGMLGFERCSAVQA